MTGPEHYRRAELAIEKYREAATNAAERAQKVRTVEAAIAITEGPRALLELAQVHATLALAAATIAGSNAEWREALS